MLTAGIDTVSEHSSTIETSVTAWSSINDSYSEKLYRNKIEIAYEWKRRFSSIFT